jgi:Ras-related protein Rab-6A
MNYEDTKIPSFKVIMLGNSTVGKTSILTQLCSNVFDGEPKTTIGGSFIEKEMETKKGKVKLHLWDTAGQEQYRCLVPIYSRDVGAAIIVFDVTKPKTFETADEWFDLVNRNKTYSCAIFAVVNKMDLEAELDLKIVEEWATEHKAHFFKTSAKDSESIKALFQCVAETLVLTNLTNNEPNTVFDQQRNNEKGCC